MSDPERYREHLLTTSEEDLRRERLALDYQNRPREETPPPAMPSRCEQPPAFFDSRGALRFIERAVKHYEPTAPTVVRYLEDVYDRLRLHAETVNVRELVAVTRLVQDGYWLQPNYAANFIYKTEEMLGRDIRGQAGF